MRRVNRILVPTDFSRSAGKALEYAADLALKYDAGVDVVHVVALASAIDRARGRESLADVEGGGPQRLAESVAPELSRSLAALDGYGVSDARGRLVPGSPSRAILTMAQSGDYQLIVMATHGGTGLADVLIGSCTERVVRRSPIPVLVIPSPRDVLDEDPWKDQELEELSGWVRGDDSPAPCSSRALQSRPRARPLAQRLESRRSAPPSMRASLGLGPGRGGPSRLDSTRPRSPPG